MSTLKVDTLDTSNGTGNITLSRPLSGSGASLTSLPAASLTGTIADARFPATLPAASGANLTSLPAANVTGTLAVAKGGTGTTTYTALMNAIYDGSPDSDHTATGPQTNTLAAGYSTTIMDLVYLGSSSKWLEADADATGTSINLLGIALEAKTDTQAMNVALPGSFVRDDTWAWTPGVPLYISNTLGAITATKPTGSGDVVRTVGFAVHADMIYFNPSSDYVTLA
jgi:hypothetical protein